MTSIERDFLLCLVGLSKSGFDPWAVYVHAWHESAGFSAVIGTGNFWGIGVPKGWAGKTVKKTTTEYNRARGENEKIVKPFADFPSDVDAFVHYRDLIERVYPSAYHWRGTPTLFFLGLVNGEYQWATDPLYESKLRKAFGICLQDADKVFAINMVKEVAEGGGKLTFF